MTFRRRDLLRAVPLALLPRSVLASALDPLAAIERTLAGGRLGVFAVDLASGRTLVHRAGERFAMCSTMKLPLVGAVLAAVDAGRLRLDQPVTITPEARKLYSPSPIVTDAPTKTLPLLALCRAAVTVSDNASANLLLPLVGDPAGLTRFMTAAGGAPTRLDRPEPELNTNLPGDPRDTTTPRAMVAILRRLAVGGGLGAASAGLLTGWLVETATGAKRLRAGFPTSWRAGDKTGTGDRGSVNDVAIAWPVPGRAPMLVACYIDAPAASRAVAEAAHAAVARRVAGLT